MPKFPSDYGIDALIYIMTTNDFGQNINLEFPLQFVISVARVYTILSAAKKVIGEDNFKLFQFKFIPLLAQGLFRKNHQFYG